jgi:MtN3 and saliva related transmembrane protein
MDDPWAVIGLIAGTLTTAGYIPQIVKGFRTKRLDDVSYLLLLLLGTGMTLWLVYGLLLVSIPLIISNTIATGLVVLLILMKHRYALGAKNAGNQQGNQ